MQCSSKRDRWLPVLLVAVALSAGACGADATGGAAASFAYSNPLFQNTYPIEASVGAKEIDGGSLSAKSGTPNFSWPATNFKHVVCAVFDEPIGVKNNTITNTHRVVWMWHSGLPQGREGNVTWDQGVANATSLNAPTVLAKGKYYWAVWALNAQGIPARSSVEKTYQVQ
jgi:hypothetical protein